MEGTREVHNSVVLKLTTSIKKYHKIREGNNISGSQRQEWQVFEGRFLNLPSLFEFSQM